MKNITDILIDKINEVQNPTVAGLDTRIDFLPESMTKNAKSAEDKAKAITEYNYKLIDALKGIVPSVKIQSAYYEMYAHYGVKAMNDTAAYAKKNGMVVMADVKRNDIGATAEAYAAAYLEDSDYDYITVNPYPGYDGIKPFVDAGEKNGKGIFVLARMSNPSAAELQNLDVGGEPLYMRVGSLIEKWGASVIGKHGYSAVGAVVGATNPTEAKELRKRFKTVFFLVPGYGAQGGKGADAAASFDEKGGGAIVNNSRGLIAAYKNEKYKGMTYYEAAAAAACDMREDLMRALKDNR
ncbi:MAG: orotidine-5'-phosphate decarboxylase [Clostridiales bacterium]|nr:orotidine-5'-phosphate decarboxylase [Clostridiales bacterium]